MLAGGIPVNRTSQEFRDLAGARQGALSELEGDVG